MLARTGLRYEWIHAWALLTGHPLINVGLVDDAPEADASWRANRLRPYERLWTTFQHAAPGAATHDVLEIGCGQGEGLRYLSERLAGVRLVGLDRSRIAQAAGRMAGLDIHRGRYQDLPFADDSFDVVVAVEALLYGDIAEGLIEIHRVLRPGGRLLVAQFMSHDAEEAQARLDEAWRHQGLALVRFVDLTAEARRSVVAGEPKRRAQVRCLPPALRARQAEFLTLKGSKRYDDWMSGRECYYAAVFQAI